MLVLLLGQVLQTLHHRLVILIHLVEVVVHPGIHIHIVHEFVSLVIRVVISITCNEEYRQNSLLTRRTSSIEQHLSSRDVRLRTTNGVFSHHHLEGDMVDLILDCLLRGDMGELTKVSPEFRFPPDYTITDGLGIFPLEFESILLLLNDSVRVDLNRRLGEALIALTRPTLLALL